jgi:hypothetical protein
MNKTQIHAQYSTGLSRANVEQARTMIALHATGHTWATDGALLRVDFIDGKWVATRYDERLVVTDRLVGTDEMVHDQITRWSSANWQARHGFRPPEQRHSA